MKKHLFITILEVLAAAALMLFISCSDIVETDIVGDWELELHHAGHA